ncbi:MAG: electron transfer flavoprotein subunit alpha [bacterium]|nr:electron transfer flavoprotein subunit alpha [bacterium]
MPLIIDQEKCTGCAVCLERCPFNALTIVDNLAKVDDVTCTLCGACAKQGVCPFDAITLLREKKEAKSGIAAHRNIWIFAEQKKGVLQGVVYELLGKARELADVRQQEVWAVLLGKTVAHKAQELIACGADKVVLVEDDCLEFFEDETYSTVITRLCRNYKPEIVLCGATTIGRALIPRVAVQLKTGLTADCTELHIDPEKQLLVQTRPAFGGNIMARILCPQHRPQMSTVRHKVFPAAQPDSSRTGEIIREAFNAREKANNARVVDVIEILEDTVNLTEANIIVSGGRGIKGPANFAMLHDLAKAVGGAVGASRAAVDEGWVQYSHQVGQTGKTVNPKVYIACGISGQIQHLVGMQSSDVIIAINKDPDAPMMKIATLALCGDLFQIIPELIKQMK